MGAWGLGPFENDGALDSLSDVENGDAEALTRCFESALASVDYLEVDGGQAVIAAAELVAAAAGRPAASLPQRVVDVLAVHGDAIRALAATGPARAAVARALAAQSELAELWDESGDGPAWRQSVADLQRRLAASEV